MDISNTQTLDIKTQNNEWEVFQRQEMLRHPEARGMGNGKQRHSHSWWELGAEAVGTPPAAPGVALASIDLSLPEGLLW